MTHHINVLNEKFDIELHDDELLSNIIRERGIYSRNDLMIFSQILNEGDIFIDIGANIGWHTLFGALKVGKTGRVYAFEPVKTNYDVLVKNIQINKLDQVFPVCLAVSDLSETATIYCSPNNFGDNVIALNSIPSYQKL